jgi:hypothetical protein
MNNVGQSLRGAAIAAACTLGIFTGGCRRDGGASLERSEAALFPTGATFGTGWSYVESDGETTFRWMSARGEVRLARAARWSTMRLFVHLVTPRHLFARAPTIRVVLDGVELDRFEAGAAQDRVYLVPARTLRHGSEPELVIETSETVRAQERILGVALVRASWDSVGGAT